MHAQTSDYSLRYFDDSNGLHHGRISKMLQDRHGMMWIATWNGLYRFDGEQFVAFKTRPGDGISMPGNRIRDIQLDDDGDIYCQIEERILRFDVQQCRFDTLPTEEEQKWHKQMGEQRQAIRANSPKKSDQRAVGSHLLSHIMRDMRDRQGNRWLVDEHGFYIATPIHEHGTKHTDVEARAVRQMRNGDIWVAERQAKRLVAYSYDWSSCHTILDIPAYCICETHDGAVWVGCKPGPVRMTADGKNWQEIPVNDVYDIVEDSIGRIWMASFAGGIYCWDGQQIHAHADHLQSRRLWLSPQGVMLAATVEGLLVIDNIYASDTQLRIHQREPNRVDALGSNAVMSITELDGQIHLGLGTAGVDRLLTADLHSDSFTFEHFTAQQGLGSEIVYEILPMTGNRLLIQRNNGVSIRSAEDNTILNFDGSFFGREMYMGEVPPVLLHSGELLLSTRNGLITIAPDELTISPEKVHIAICSVLKGNGQADYATDYSDTIHLSKAERSVTIRFAALDYRNHAKIHYRTCLQRRGSQSAEWSTDNLTHEVQIQDLAPGEYTFTIEASNGEGHWIGNTRALCIIVQPTFLESRLGQFLLYISLLLIVVGTTYYILRVRTLHARQQELLRSYLNLQERMRDMESVQETKVLAPGLSGKDEQFINALRLFVEEQMDNSDVLVDDMARYLGMSRTALNQKMRQLFNLSPADFLREARIKHACELLRTTDMQAKEVAYACGFSDPKYFTKCFKQSIGKTPTEYKARTDKTDFMAKN